MIRIFGIFLHFLLLLLLSGFVLPSFAQDLPNSSEEALVWLKKIAIAPRQHNYLGTFIYYADEHMETSSIVHIVDDKGEREKIEVLDGLQRIVIRNNDEMICYLPESKTVVTERRWFRKFFPDILPRSFGDLNDSYFVKKGKQERVTGFDCQVIILQPRDSLRYGQKIWVDMDTGLVLKVAVMDGDQIIEQFAFAQLKVGEGIRSELLESKYSKLATDWRTTNLMTSVLENGALEWQVENPPAGFKKIIEMKRNLAGRPMLVDHIALSDDFATVSIFIEPILANMAPPLSGFYSSRGAINIYVRIVDGNIITTVGEVPLETVKLIGDSVSRQEIKASTDNLKH
ncbi:MAG: MucB/RseB C-terminal domain-containing protein [Nitrosomonas sp.]|nr:MucB/RseB C-terminal domain-containing protein [Nitrosomonas sp.]MDP1951427.1 MucB/RseB C-terminal domain-containing protein [Nitrosomonas sp.]